MLNGTALAVQVYAEPLRSKLSNAFETLCLAALCFVSILLVSDETKSTIARSSQVFRTWHARSTSCLAFAGVCDGGRSRCWRHVCDRGRVRRFRKPSDNASLVRNDSELTNLDLKEKLLSPDP